MNSFDVQKMTKGKFQKKFDSNICSTTHESLTYKNHRIEGLYLYNLARRCMHQIAEEHKSEILSRYIPNCSIHLFLLLFKHFFSQQNKFYAGAAFISTFWLGDCSSTAVFLLIFELCEAKRYLLSNVLRVSIRSIFFGLKMRYIATIKASNTK